jgi:hypothetical protein
MDKHRLGEPNPTLLDEDVRRTLSEREQQKLDGTDPTSRVLAKHAEGLTVRAIVEQTGIGSGSIYRILSANKLTANREQLPKVNQLSIWQRYRRDKLTPEAIVTDCLCNHFEVFAKGLEDGINTISVRMGISKKILKPIVTELLK